MTVADKIVILRDMIDTDDKDAVLTAYLSLAREKILAKAYPFGSDGHEMPEKYARLQIEIAAYLLNKRGAEGQLSHSENGISRSYESGDVPDSMLRAVTPFCGVVS